MIYILIYIQQKRRSAGPLIMQAQRGGHCVERLTFEGKLKPLGTIVQFQGGPSLEPHDAERRQSLARLHA